MNQRSDPSPVQGRNARHRFGEVSPHPHGLEGPHPRRLAGRFALDVLGEFRLAGSEDFLVQRLAVRIHCDYGGKVLHFQFPDGFG